MTDRPKAIAVDAMGGDFGLDVTLPATLAALRDNPDLHFYLVGDRTALQAHLDRNELTNDQQARLHIEHADETIAMHEDPLRALKSKKGSSMHRAIGLVKDNKAQACVSAGNTGALLAIANYMLGRLPGVSRPGLITAMPTRIDNKAVHVIDLGANIDCQPTYLRDFAVMGSVKISATENIDRPKIGLLSNGSEDIKGNQLVKETAALLQSTQNIHYTGYIEPDAVLNGDIDLVVCDGFTGNIALKSLEGAIHFLKDHLKKTCKKSLYGKIIGLCILPLVKKSFRDLNPHRYNGASLLGVKGIVIKSHGSTNIEGFSHAIHEAIMEVEHNVPEMLQHQLHQEF